MSTSTESRWTGSWRTTRSRRSRCQPARLYSRGGEQAQRVVDVRVDQLLGGVDAAADHPAGFDEAHPGADEEAGPFESADDVRVEVGDRGPIGFAEALAVGRVDHPEAFGDHPMVPEDLADLTGADEVAEFVDAVLDALRPHRRGS